MGTGSEQVWVSVKLARQDRLLVGCFYRSPQSIPENDKLLNESIIRSTTMGYSHILLVGDFNHPHIDWTEEGALHAGDQKGRTFVETIQDSYLYQHVLHPTRVRYTQLPSLLDQVFSNEKNMVTNLKHLAPLGNSDHCVLTFKFICYTAKLETTTTKYQYGKGNYREMRRDLTQDWDDMFQDCQDDPEQQYQIFLQLLMASQAMHIPRRVQTHKRRTVYPISNRVKAEARRKHRLWTRYMENRTDERYRQYATQRNRVKKLTRAEKQQYENRLA